MLGSGLFPTPLVAAPAISDWLPLLLVAAAVLVALAAAWAVAAWWLHRRMVDLAEDGHFGPASEAGEKWFRIWPARRAGAIRLAHLYSESDRADVRAIEGLVRVLPYAPDPIALARTAADRVLRAETPPDREVLLSVIDVLRLDENPPVSDRLSAAALYRMLGLPEPAKEVLRGVGDLKDSAEAILRMRDILLEEGGSDPEAEDVYRESLAYEPDHPEAVMALYRILENRWDTLESSLGLYDKALSLDPSLKWAHTAMAEIWRGRGREEEAIRHFLLAGKDEDAETLLKKRLDKHPEDHRTLAALKDFYLERKRVDSEARAVYARWKRASPGDLTFDAFLLDVYEDKGYRGADAVEIYEKAVAMDAKEARLRLLLSECYRLAGRVRDAVWLLEEARDDFPDAADVQEALVRLYASEGVKTGRALEEAVNFVEREFDEPVALYLREHFLNHDSPQEIAVRALEAWRARNPEDREALARLARLFIARRDATRGIPALRTLSAKGDTGPWSVRGLAELYALSVDLSPKAEEAYSHAIASGIATDPVVGALARVYAGAGRKDILAAEVYHRAAGVEGCPPDVKVKLAEVYFDAKSWDDAISLCREVIRLDPAHEEARRLEARSLLKSGHVEGALDGLWKAFRDKPADFQTAQDIAEALAGKNDTSPEAVAVYEKFLTLARRGLGRFHAETGWAIMKTLGLARFRSDQVDKGISILKALYSKEASCPAGERMATEASESVPDDVALRLGGALMDAGDFSRAKPLFLRGLAADPEALEGALERIRAARDSFPGRLGQTIEICESIRDAVGDRPSLMWEIVEGILLEGDVDEAAVRTRAILGPGEGPDPDLAESHLQAMRDRWMGLIAEGHESSSVLYLQGRLRLALNELEEARIWLVRSRSKDARDRHVLAALKRTYQAFIDAGRGEDSKEKLADLMVEEGNLDAAIPLLQSISEEYGHRREVVAKLAKCFIGKGHPLIASKHLERALGEEEVEAENADMFYTLADAYESASDFRKSKFTFEKIGFWNYAYRDVGKRLDELGRVVVPTPSTPVTPSPLSPVSERRTIGGVETAELPVGKVEGGRFEVLELRGRGGMAIVYKALDHEFDPPLLVALKVLPEDFAHREKAVRLLKREASAAIQLTHPGIVRIFSTGEEQGKRYISMEYIEGPDFATIMDRKGNLPPEDVERHLRQIIDALGYAHSMGVIHKDIKPSNIMLTENTPAGSVKITDFGIARVVTDQIGFSRTLSVRGTLPYMSPQQIAGEQADAQSDIYSLGVMLYEMLAGDPPFVRGDIAYQHTYKEPPALLETAKGIPPYLDALVMKCLRKKLVARYKSTAEVLADLDRKAVDDSKTTL